MKNKYGTKAWARWACQSLDFALMLLKEPDKKWDENNTHLDSAIKSLGIIKNELEEERLDKQSY